MYDYIIVGSGVAGLFTAYLAARRGRVLLLTKGELAESNTRYAQGGIAAAVDPADSPASHRDDTLAAGAGLCEPSVVDLLTSEAPARIADLVQLGVAFDRDDGRLALGHEGAHCRARVLHAGGDATGAQVEAALCRAVRSVGVDVREHHFVTGVVVERGRVRGVRFLDAADHAGGCEGIVVVLASGGSGQLFEHSTNPEIATGDGLAVAYRAGATLANLEFYQFHPTAFTLPGAPTFLISEAVRGEGGVLRNSVGRAFMREYDNRGELASRDVVSRAIFTELTRSGDPCVYLDVTHLDADLIRRRFPTIVRFCAEHEVDVTREPIPVSPAAHYQMGGVLTDQWGETTIAGLYACGEVAASGVHGANRLASNSLLEGVVFASRVVRRTLGDGAAGLSSALLPPLEVAGPIVGERRAASTETPTFSRRDLQHLMWRRLGMVRSAADLDLARSTLGAWAAALPTPTGRADRELENLLLVGRLMAEAAALRVESRGAHYRTDFPEGDPHWQRRIDLRAVESGEGQSLL